MVSLVLVSAFVAALLGNHQVNADCPAGLRNCKTCQADATEFECEACDTSRLGFDLKNTDKSKTTGSCYCSALPAPVPAIFNVKQSDFCSLARPTTALADVAGMDTAAAADYWKTTLMGCVGPKPNNLLVSQVDPNQSKYTEGDKPCHPDVNIRGGVGSTLAMCGNTDAVIYKFNFKAMTERSQTGVVATTSLETEWADKLNGSQTRVCNNPGDVAAVSVGSFKSARFFLHGAIFKASGFADEAMNLQTLTGDAEQPIMKYWNEEKQYLGADTKKAIDASNIKITAGISSFPWSNDATDDSQGCFEIAIEATDTDGSAATGVDTAEEIWFDNITNSMYFPVHKTSLSKYKACKQSPFTSVCGEVTYVVASFSMYVSTVKSGLADANYIFDGDTKVLYVCAAKSVIGTGGFAMDPVTKLGAGPTERLEQPTTTKETVASQASGLLSWTPLAVLLSICLRG